MTDEQRRHLDAGINGDKALTKFNALFGLDLPLMTRQGKLQIEITKVQDYEQTQLRNLGYRTKTIHDLQTLEGQSWAIAKITHEYAIDINDDVLAHKVAFNKSDFNHGSIAQIKVNAKSVFNATSGAVVTAMVAAGYHITALDVANLGTAISTLEADEGMPKVDIASAKAATTGLKNEVHHGLDPAIDSVVDYITPYALSNLDVYNTVVDSFEITEIGIRHIALRIRVSDDTTHTRCGHAVISIDGPGIETGKKVEKQTSKRGIADYAHEELPEGNYTVTVTLRGYKTMVFNNVGVFDDRMSLLDVQMTRTI